MRESNFSNPLQNKACVCISAAIYDRRALDCTATLPLINSLNHLAYLTSTSPRIREMVCLDGGLERLIRILRLVPRSPSQPPMRGVITKEMQAVWKWSLAFQCVVNIGVRGSETVRTRVVEAGMVSIAVRVLESYLRIAEAIREERKREARREDAKLRLERAELAAAQSAAQTSASPTPPRPVALLMDSSSNATVTPHDTPAHRTARQHASPFQHATTASRIAEQNIINAAQSLRQGETRPAAHTDAILGDFMMTTSHSASSLTDPTGPATIATPSLPEDGSTDEVNDILNPMTGVEASILSPSTSSSSVGRPGRATNDTIGGARPGVLTNASSVEDFTASGSGSDGADDGDLDAADDSDSGNALHRDDEMESERIVEDRTTPRPPRRALAPTVDAPSNASDATPGPHFTTPTAASITDLSRQRADVLQASMASSSTSRADMTNATPVAAPHHRSDAAQTPRVNAYPAAAQTTGTEHRVRTDREPNSHLPDMIYREEEVLLSLQLLAYLSKYAHVRTLFHRDLATLNVLDPLGSLDGQNATSKDNASWSPNDPPKKNVFCIAERYTLRSSRTGLSHFAALGESRIAPEIQYWAGVIMRNACRKDEKQGGIRQCANMLCGKWEKQPREFAKCRRCRKAKYCSKQCQSKGWQMGHRFWCSARSDEEHGEGVKDRSKDSTTETRNTATDATTQATIVGPNGPMTLATGVDGQDVGEAEDMHRMRAHQHRHDGGMARLAQENDIGTRAPQIAVSLANRSSSADAASAHFSRGTLALASDGQGVSTASMYGRSEVPMEDEGRRELTEEGVSHPDTHTARRGQANYGALTQSGASLPSSATRRAVSAIPQHLQMQQRLGIDPGSFGSSHSRSVSTASSSADVSDVSEDEMERASRRVLASTVAPAQRSPAGGQITQLANVFTAVEEASHHADHQVRRRNGSDAATLIGVPTRTDLAGRPLPPPVIARHDAPANLDLAMTPDNDLLTLGGRLTPTPTDDVETGAFGRGDFDQMIWRGRTPSLDDNARGGVRGRSHHANDDFSAGASGSDDNGESSGNTARRSTITAATFSESPSMLNSALNLAHQDEGTTPRFANATLHTPIARSAHRYASVNSTPFAAHPHSERSGLSSSHVAAPTLSTSPTPMRSAAFGRASFLQEFDDWRTRPAASTMPPHLHDARPSLQDSASNLSSTVSSASASSSALQQTPNTSRGGGGRAHASGIADEAFVVPSEIQNLFDAVEMQSTPRTSAVYTATDMDIDG